MTAISGGLCWPACPPLSHSLVLNRDFHGVCWHLWTHQWSRQKHFILFVLKLARVCCVYYRKVWRWCYFSFFVVVLFSFLSFFF